MAIPYASRLGTKTNLKLIVQSARKGDEAMTDREKVIKGLEYHLKELSVGKTCFECNYCGDNPCEIHLITDALALLKDQENEYEKGFNDAMQDKQELMYEGIDGKWHKKDW